MNKQKGCINKEKKKKRLMKPKHYCSYSALTVQKYWMYSDIYKREKKSTNRRLKKKVSTVATWYCSYCSKLERKKKKVANQNGIVNEQ